MWPLEWSWQIFWIMVGLMSGILSLGREVATLKGKKVTNVKFWACMRIAFILAAVLVWRAEHQRADQLHVQLSLERDRDTPNLIGKIEQVYNGYTPELNATSLFLMALVKNTGAPTVVEGWNLDVEYGGAKFSQAPSFISDGLRLFDESKKVIATFRRQDAIKNYFSGSHWRTRKRLAALYRQRIERRGPKKAWD